MSVIVNEKTAAQHIAHALRRHGVQLIFAQSLPSAVVLACEDIGIRQVAYRQENMGGAMADGYSRISGKIGVVCAQNGPAATLLVPPLAEALKASIPIVALVQEVERPQSGRNAFQEIDHSAVFSSCAKWIGRPLTADRIVDFVDQAFVVAGSGRPGPAVLLLPADLLRERVDITDKRVESYGSWPIDRTRPDDLALSSAANLIQQAKHPVLMAGGGVHSGAAPALALLVDTAHLPVFTTNMGKGAMDEQHPLACGVLGALNGARSVGSHTRAIFAEADVVVLAGTRTNQNGTDSWRLIAPEAKVIHIDIDPVEIGRNYEATVRLVGDAGATLEALAQKLKVMDLSKRRNGRGALERRIAQAWSRFQDDRRPLLLRNSGPARPELVMAELQKKLTADTIVVADASYSSMWVVGQLRGLANGMRFVTPRGLAGLGWGLPLAIGAKLAWPESPVVALVGDGGFAHSWAELETLVRCRLALTVVVLNNGVLGFQKDAETVKFGKYTSACHFAEVDHVAIARACGCQAVRIDDPAEIAGVLEDSIGSTQPWLIEVMTDPAAHPPLSLYDGTLDASTTEMRELA